jgi:two-component system, NtrC family, sensor kinase
MTGPPDDSTADLQAVITALRAERDRALSEKATLAEELAARTGELTQRDSGYSERIGHQAATETLKVENQELRAAQAAGLEVLQAMIASPGDTQPVFDLIARQAANLCEVPIAAVGLFDGTMVHLATQSGFDAAYADVFAKQFPRSPSPDFAMGRAILNRRVEQIEDTGADTRRGFSPPPGPGSALAVPLLRNGTPLGVIAVGRRARGFFSRNQITLLETFAEQAVIAIGSAETYSTLQARTADLQESLEQQTATAEVLQVINASPGNLVPVFDAMLEKAIRLCGSSFGSLATYDGEAFHVVAMRGVPPALAEFFHAPILPVPGMTLYRTVHGEDVVHVADLTDDEIYRSEIGRAHV